MVKEAAKLLVTNSVRSTLSMRSMLLLGGLGACPPSKILKNRCSEMASENIFIKRKFFYFIYVFAAHVQ